MELADHFIAIVRELGCRFTIKGQPVTVEEVFAAKALFPAVMKRADQLASFCFGTGLGVSFNRTGGSILGVRVEFDDNTSNTFRLLCALDVVVEIIQNSNNQEVVPLDDLTKDT